MRHMLIFGLSYTSGRLASRLHATGWCVSATRRSAGPDAMTFDDREAVLKALAKATHILSSIPPGTDGDPVLLQYGDAIAAAPATWIGYLSSTGVYGDTGGAWVDETAPVGTGRRSARAKADLAWQALRPDVRIFRLPGIYGPGRNVLDRIRDGDRESTELPGRFSDGFTSMQSLQEQYRDLLSHRASPPHLLNCPQ